MVKTCDSVDNHNGTACKINDEPFENYLSATERWKAERMDQLRVIQRYQVAQLWQRERWGDYLFLVYIGSLEAHLSTKASVWEQKPCTFCGVSTGMLWVTHSVTIETLAGVFCPRGRSLVAMMAARRVSS